MDIAQLQAFISVADTGSFSKASEKLFLTQPAISKRISALESDLDCPLFDRIGKQVQLTEAGKQLKPRAEHILLELEDSRRSLQNLSGRIEGRLSIGTSHHIGLHRLPEILRTYSQKYQHVDLDLRFMDSEAVCDAVERGAMEMGIVTLPVHPSPHLNLIAVWDDPLAIVLATDHLRLNNLQADITELAGIPAILPSKGTFTRELIEQTLASFRFPLNVSLETNYLETIKMMVSVGLGWSVLPISMLDSSITAIPYEQIDLSRTLGIVHHQSRTLSNAAKALIETVTSQANI